MKKNYVLDTNVLIHDPSSIYQFEDNDVYIPIYVLEELDKLKNETTSLRGRNSREACRNLDILRSHGSLSEGVRLNDDIEGKLIIFVPQKRKVPPVGFDKKDMDALILQSALEIQTKYNSNLKTILVTMDFNLRVRAETLGLQTASYESQSVDASRLITGYDTIEVEKGQIDLFFKDGKLNHEGSDFYHNICLMLKEPDGKTSLGRFNKNTNEIIPLHLPKEGVMGIKPRNRGQQFALNLLLDNNIKLVTLLGPAGTGKTLLASAAGLSEVLDEEYSRLLVSRPVIPMGEQDIGFLPGTAEEKLHPWMQPIYDNMELLMMTSKNRRKKGADLDYLFDQDLVRIEPLTYIRGRSLPSQFILIDEAQNLSRHELITIITRCGENSKIVLTGDPDQIDNPYMDKGSCGLSLVAEKMHDNFIVGHLTLSKGERSELANLAAEKLMSK